MISKIQLKFGGFQSKSKISITRTSGAYGPLVLAPTEGMGALRALYFCLLFLYFLYFFLSFLSFLSFLPFCLFAFLPICLFVFLSFCLFAFFHICTTPNFVMIQQFFNFTTHFTTHFTTNITTNHYHYCHPPFHEIFCI